MELGMIGLGKMGLNMAQRLTQNSHRVVAFDRQAAAIKEAEKFGAVGSTSLSDMVSKLKMPRVLWMMSTLR